MWLTWRAGGPLAIDILLTLEPLYGVIGKRKQRAAASAARLLAHVSAHAERRAESTALDVRRTYEAAQCIHACAAEEPCGHGLDLLAYLRVLTNGRIADKRRRR